MRAAIAGILFLALQSNNGQGIDPTAVPVDQEPHHKIVFQNEAVRVVDATFPAGYVTLMHTHAVDNVAITLATGQPSGPADVRIGRVGFSKGGYSHKVTNSGAFTQRFFDVEILGTPKNPMGMASDFPKHTVEIDNERVRVYRITLAPGETQAAHQHSAGYLRVMVQPATFGWVPEKSDETTGRISGVMNSPTQPLTIIELEPK